MSLSDDLRALARMVNPTAETDYDAAARVMAGYMCGDDCRTCPREDYAPACRDCWADALDGIADEMDKAEAPLDADGAPIRPGDEVWHIDDEGGASPIRVKSASLVRRVIIIDRSSGRFDYNPSTLTHKRPGGWGALEDDATRDPREYALRRGIPCGDVPAETMALDLIARAKKLAGVEE